MDSWDIDGPPFRENLENRNWEAVASVLGVGAVELKNPSAREILSVRTVQSVAGVLRDIVTDEDWENAVIALIETYRLLRNACCVKAIQNAVIETTIFDDTAKIFFRLFGTDDRVTCSNQELLIHVATQFLGNTVVENELTQVAVWNKFSAWLMKIVANCPVKIGDCACMVVYIVLLNNSDVCYDVIPEDMINILHCQAKGSEFATFLVERMLAQDRILESMYEKFSVDNRLLLLDAVWITLMEKEDLESEKAPVPVEGMKYFAIQVKLRADTVLNMLEKGTGAEPAETLRLLEVLATASSRSAYQRVLQQDSSLLISCACLLKAATEVGHQGNSVFTSVQRLSDLRSVSSEAAQHPAFGFKVSLVRLVANLCYRHKKNQDQVRELGCLPAVLDACNLDVHNPLLLQWGILAVRNLLEDSDENKQIIAGLISKGPASNAVLRELGVVLEESKDGKLCIAPMRRD